MMSISSFFSHNSKIVAVKLILMLRIFSSIAWTFLMLMIALTIHRGSSGKLFYHRAIELSCCCL